MPSTSKAASNGLALSLMIQTSAKVKSTYIDWMEDDVFRIRFRHPRHARAFQDAFDSFVHASKRTVKNVQAKERAERQAARTSP